MPVRRSTLLRTGALALAAVITVIGAATVGAVTAPQPLADAGAAAAVATPATEGAQAATTPAGHTALGVIVAIDNPHLEVRVKIGAAPVQVTVGPNTVVQLNRQPATLDDFHVGDVVAVVGQPGPRGAVNARAVAVFRRPGAAQSLIQQLAKQL